MARNYNKLCKFGVSKFSRRRTNNDDVGGGGGDESANYGAGSPRIALFLSLPRNAVDYPRGVCV